MNQSVDSLYFLKSWIHVNIDMDHLIVSAKHVPTSRANQQLIKGRISLDTRGRVQSKLVKLFPLK